MGQSPLSTPLFILRKIMKLFPRFLETVDRILEMFDRANSRLLHLKSGLYREINEMHIWSVRQMEVNTMYCNICPLYIFLLAPAVTPIFHVVHQV
jgi:hypothetical protein